MDLNKTLNDMFMNLSWNFTWLAEPVKNGVVFNYDPEAPVLDKRGKPTGKTYGKLTTTILFSDGTKCTCSNSCHDKVNSVLVSEVNGVKLPTPVVTADDSAKEFGITQCIFKRLVSSIGKDGTMEKSCASRWLKQKIADSYDQGVMEVYGKAVKKLEAENNIKKHDADAKKAHDRKVKKLAKRIALQREAEALLAAKKASGCSCTGTKKPLYETKIAVKPAIKPITEPKTCCCKTKTASSGFSAGDKPYVRPNKRFSEFTQAEKREYWKAQKRGWL